MTSTEIIRALKNDGWKPERVKGSHHHFVHATKPGVVTVVHPSKDIPLPEFQVKNTHYIFKKQQILKTT
jgi:predicted RNA binding protein YcfA (HicA-like mRNA interferase family)